MLIRLTETLVVHEDQIAEVSRSGDTTYVRLRDGTGHGRQDPKGYLWQAITSAATPCDWQARERS